MAKAKKYKLLSPALGLEAGEIVTGPVADVLVANGKAVPVEEKPESKAEADKR